MANQNAVKGSSQSSHNNVYPRKGLYADGFNFIRQTCKGVVTRSCLVAFLAKTIQDERNTVTAVPKHMKKRYRTLDDYKDAKAILSAANATATVLLSPRAVGPDQSSAKKGVILSTSGRGDCRGNFSAMGHIYFMEPLKQKKDGEQAYRLRWRNPILESHIRPLTESKNEVKVTKTKKVKIAAPVAPTVVAETTAPVATA